VSVTGNVLRDYLTDLFPILEIGTSAKMLSIVPLLAGGGLFETGAGGSAPKHVQQFQKEGYLRWDSLGEFSALGASLEHIALTTNNPKAGVLANTLDTAIGRFLDNNKSPARKVGEIDNRGSTSTSPCTGPRPWPRRRRTQTSPPTSRLWRRPSARTRRRSTASCGAQGQPVAAQGRPVDLGGYYHPDAVKVAAAMRPSATLNAIIETAGAADPRPPRRAGRRSTR
jgi:isocitrate dehydrogenase